MGRNVSATEAVRSFSELLNSVKYKGQSYTIMRGGKPIAAIVPVEKVPQEQKLGELPEFLKSLPSLGDDAEAFAHDIEAALMHQPAIPEKSSWE